MDRKISAGKKIILFFKRLFGRRHPAADTNASQKHIPTASTPTLNPSVPNSASLSAPIASVPISPAPASDHTSAPRSSEPIAAAFDPSSTSASASFAETSDLPTLPTGEYEVFLSFRGPDTRKEITDIIYRFLVHLKIRTFKDDDELRKGEGIWPNLVRAIGESKIYVPILSESYAHSKWCLKELAEIVKRQKQDRRHIILPIFYMVDPRDVRHQTGPYYDAFQQHERNFDEHTIRIWKESLTEVGRLKGWHVKSKDEQGAIADLVSDVVWSHLSKNNDALLDITDELVGIDDHVKAVVDILSNSGEGVVMVGIHGVGGVGKTTLATTVYSKIFTCFDRCCFVEKIRETQQQLNGNLILQKKLISDILRMDSVDFVKDETIARKTIRERVSEFKILVVLDDVDDMFKFEEILGDPRKFISGSRFIATSRNTSVLRSLNQEQCKLYAVDVMGFDRSLQLFCKHAFRKDSPPPDFDALSRDILSTAGGLPLMLKVVGQLLYKQEVAVWEEKLAQLKETPEKEVMERLKISYNALEYEAQQIFLDIACFFIGADKDIASYMWADCNFRPITNINILTQRSMIKIDEDSKFQMHDQLRDMGREIVRRENIDVPWMRSRIWSYDIAANILDDKKGMDKVKGIRLISEKPGDGINHHYFERDCFTNLSELRYFEAPEIELIGDFRDLLPNLKWLCLSKHQQYFKETPLTNLNMENLVILDLQDSYDLDDNWDGWWHVQEANRLKVLDLTGCVQLTKIPNLPGSGSIEILNLSGLLHSSGKLHIGNLRSLKVLNLKDCGIRKIKGGTIGMIQGLRKLDVTNSTCENLGEFLSDIFKLSSLQILRSVGTKASEKQVLAGKLLPASLKELTTCSPIANLSELLELEILVVKDCHDGVDIPKIDNGWCKSSKLNSLELINTKINDLPTSTNVLQLPSSLVKLHISECEELQWLPNLTNLKNLIELVIKHCINLGEIQCLGGLKSLETLEITGNDRLTHLDDIPDNKLKVLEISYCPLLSSIKFTSSDDDDFVVDSLEKLIIDHCTSLELEVGLVLSHLSKFSRLNVLKLKTVIGSEVLELPSLEELAQLEMVNLQSTRTVKLMSNLRKLEYLELSGMPNLHEIEGLAELKSLKRIKLVSCASLAKFELSGLQKLEVLHIQKECMKLERLPSLANLVNLRELSINHLPSLREIGNDIQGLKSLEKLDLEGCKALEMLPADQMFDLEKLRFVTIVGCKNLTVDQLIALTNQRKGFWVKGPGPNEWYPPSEEYSEGLLSTTYDMISTVAERLLGNWW